MKLTILTATYNRDNYLQKLYESIVNNLIDEMNIEWLIMDDGSSDNTNEVMEIIKLKNNKIYSSDHFEIKFFRQQNQGKMSAINNLMQYVTGELVMDCDSDDIFVNNAFRKIYEKKDILLSDSSLYGLIFLKNETPNKLSGNMFEKENEKTTMFDMYFKCGVTGEKIIVFNTDIRKKYKHELIDNEKFITEARMYHKMDEDYKVKCFNEVLVQGEYLETGYTHNIIETFKKSPKGYFEYFKEILQKDMTNVRWEKRLYALKHLILFKELCRYKKVRINNISNQILYYILLVPGKIKTKIIIKD